MRISTLPVSWSFTRVMQTRVEEDARRTLEKVAPIFSIDGLYAAFKVEEDVKRDLLRAEQHASFRFFRTYSLYLVGFGIDGISVPCEIRATIPTKYSVVTVDSELAPVFKFTQEWSMLHYVVRNVMPYLSRGAVGAVFPWMRDLIKEQDYRFDKEAKNKNFYRNHGVNGANDRKAADACIRALVGPSGNLPAIPYLVGQAAELGNKLYTQVRLLKDRRGMSVPNDHVQVLPNMDDKYVPQELKNAVDEMREVIRSAKMGNDI